MKGSRSSHPTSHPAQRSAPPAPAAGVSQRLGVLPFEGDDEALGRALARAHPGAVAALHDRYAPFVLRLLVRVLGQDAELLDVHHEVFLQALRSLGRLRRAASLRAWIAALTVNVARGVIRRRARRRWLVLWTGDDEPLAMAAPARKPEDAEALRAVYALLDALPADERIAFALRFIEGMGLDDAAATCGVSRATIKRRLACAERRFVERARAHPALAEWIEGGARWGSGE